MCDTLKGTKQSPGHRKRRSEAMKGKSNILRKKPTEETKAKIATTLLGYKHSAETRALMSEAHLKRFVPKERLEQAEEFTLYQKSPQP
jgi:hypothetical protein